MGILSANTVASIIFNGYLAKWTFMSAATFAGRITITILNILLYYDLRQ